MSATEGPRFLAGKTAEVVGLPRMGEIYKRDKPDWPSRTSFEPFIWPRCPFLRSSFLRSCVSFGRVSPPFPGLGIRQQEESRMVSSLSTPLASLCSGPMAGPNCRLPNASSSLKINDDGQFWRGWAEDPPLASD